MDLAIILAFWVVSMLFILTPGADWAFAISAGLAKRMVVPAVSGLLVGHFMATVLVAAGVGAVIAQYQLAMMFLTVVGSIYLMWIGFCLFRSPAVVRASHDELIPTRQDWVLKGIGVSGLNPKVFLLFLALLPQFTDPASNWPEALQLFALGLVHIISCATVYFVVGFSSQAVLQSRPAAAKWFSKISGVAMLLIGALLLLDQIKVFWI